MAESVPIGTSDTGAVDVVVISAEVDGAVVVASTRVEDACVVIEIELEVDSTEEVGDVI